MRATLSGNIVDVESKPWEFNNKAGIAHAIFIRTGSARDGAQRVKVTAEQIGKFKVDQAVELPVNIFPRASDFGGQPRLEVSVDQDYVPTGAPSPRRESVNA